MPLGLLWFAIAVMILPVRCLLTGARSCLRRGWIGVDTGLWKFHAHSGQRLCTRFRSVGTESANIDANRNFITNIIDDDLTTGATGRRVVTRFPPEPNGYLHLGHAKSINLNFAVAKAYGGVTHMRFDDTNPAKEDIEYVRSILDDVRWLVTGKLQPEEDPWFGPVRHASSYFPTIYEAAEYLITKGLAYVDEQSAGKEVLCHYLADVLTVLVTPLQMSSRLDAALSPSQGKTRPTETEMWKKTCGCFVL